MKIPCIQHNNGLMKRENMRKIGKAEERRRNWTKLIRISFVKEANTDDEKSSAKG